MKRSQNLNVVSVKNNKQGFIFLKDLLFDDIFCFTLAEAEPNLKRKYELFDKMGEMQSS